MSITLTFVITDQWVGGYGAALTLTNTTSSLITSFSINCPNVTVTWNSNFVTSNGVMSPASWFAGIPANSSYTESFGGTYTTTLPTLSNFTIVVSGGSNPPSVSNENFNVTFSWDGTNISNVVAIVNGSTYTGNNCNFTITFSYDATTISNVNAVVTGGGTPNPPASNTVVAPTVAIPSKLFSPFVDTLIYQADTDIINCMNTTSQKFFNLAFIVGNSTTQTASWGGIYDISQNWFVQQVNQIRQNNGDCIIAFGGSSGITIDNMISDLPTLVNMYSTVIDLYLPQAIILDIEGAEIALPIVINRRNQALNQVQQKYPNLKIIYCVPCLSTGLDNNGIALLTNCKTNNVNPYAIQPMLFDGYQGNNVDMAQYAITGATAVYQAIQTAGLNSSVNMCIMTGLNDDLNIFTLANASTVLQFANTTSWVSGISFWSLARDSALTAALTYVSPTSSSIVQSQYAFTNIFKSFTN